MSQPASAYFLEERRDRNETHTLSVVVDTVHMADVNRPKSGEVQRFADREKPINLRPTSDHGVDARCPVACPFQKNRAATLTCNARTWIV